MKVFTTEEMIASVRRRASLTDDIGSEGTEDSDVIDVLDEVMMDEIVPQLLKFQEDFLIRTLTQAVAAGTSKYKIPKRAVGNALRDIYWKNGEQQEYLPKITRENLPFYQTDDVQVPDGFVIEGDGIRLIPPAQAGNLIISYSFRPGQLVKAADYRKVTVVSSTEVTLDSTAPTSWVAGTTLFDAHAAVSGAENRFFDLGAATVSGTQVIFSSAIDGSVDSTEPVLNGDYLVAAGNAAVPGIPRDAHPALAQAAALRFLEAGGDREALKAARQTFGRMMENFANLFETRVDGKPHILSNRRSFIISQQRRKGGW